MMGMGRLGFGIGVFFVVSALLTVVARPASLFPGGIPAAIGSIEYVLPVVAVFGIAVLATRYYIGRFSRSPANANEAADIEEALETLKQRYAAGEIDVIEFERKLETLFETETVADAEHRVETRSVSDEQRVPEESASDRQAHKPQRTERPSRGTRPRPRRGHCK